MRTTIARSVVALAALAALLAWRQPAAPRVVVMYDDAISVSGLERLIAVRAERYLIVYQNNCDPDAQKTGIIDPDKLASHVLELGGDVPSGWGVLDFEAPFDEWIQRGPDSPERKIAVDSMVRAIQRMKTLFPKVRWTYYGLPGLDYYIGGETWATASEEVKNKAIERQLAQYGPVMDACDWLAPCAYDTVGKGTLRSPPSVRAATRAWHHARTAMCVRYAKQRGRDCPVIPFVSPLYQPGGGARFNSVIPTDIMVQDTLQPIMEAGGAGIAMWTAGGRLVKLATGAISDKAYTEGGGVPAMVRNWSGDLGVPEASLRTPAATGTLEKMLSDAVVTMATQAGEVWAKGPATPGSAR